jgi:hypothetical protein
MTDIQASNRRMVHDFAGQIVFKADSQSGASITAFHGFPQDRSAV